jgi:hypothetical protein
MSHSPKKKFSATRLLKTLGQGVLAFFRNDIELKRDPSGVKVVLQAQPPKPSKRQSREQATAKRESEELQLMRAQLAGLLDELPETRPALKHLVFVEHAIGKRGLKALHKLPVDVLEKALLQLEGLVTNWSPVGLASLRSKMAVAIIDREHRNPEAEADAYRTAAVMDSRPEEVPAPEAGGNDDEALAAAYAALGHLAPAAAEVEVQSELHSPSARGLGREAARAFSNSLPPVENIQLRSLQS